MIFVKTDEELKLMREAGRITALAREAVRENIRPGITTKELDTIIRNCIESHGAVPSFLNLYGFPASACISVNREVIHGIPDGRKLAEGDIVKVDVGACVNGFHGDCAETFPVGNVSDEAKKLIEVTKQSFFEGMSKAVIGNRIGDISAAIEAYVVKHGYSVVRDYVGHGIGRSVHEEPNVPNCRSAVLGPRLTRGMTLAIEPMVNVGSFKVKVLKNKWTVVTADGSLSAHYENTVAILDDGAVILTDPN